MGVWSLADVRKHRSAGDAWIIVDGQVYDVTQFLDDHPGGPQIISQSLDSDNVGSLMRGSDDPAAHSHSDAAFDTLEKFHIGILENSQHRSKNSEDSETKPKTRGFTVDLSKPLVAQVGHLGDAYEKWVHQPIVCKESPRFFENQILESLTRTVWWVIPLVWLPFICWLLLVSSQRGLKSQSIVSCLISGVIIWSLLEYSMHRFLFHVKTSGYWSNTFHYLLHGCHHKHPMDGYRLVFPPAATLGFLSIFWPIIASLAPREMAPTILGGGILGYVIYDVTHYFLHHGVAFDQWSRRLKRYHLNHHFKNQTVGFGITSNFWDRIFGTLP
ncbi:dihydroceramide fatty acyl 2-hydroxylase FAH2 [Selaginella moellendorffii]|nr:dihydroceramide fatty acyl 2-hydroxylase FAH2 [Selaginella moellendorffii]|eukprot:XP_002987190.2 dihydroceramide fatty acyl 2-hydroxylase FAH2 [Selaginella moellendorffii]